MTAILGPTLVSLDAAQAWAQSLGAHQRFIDVAPLYWSIAPRYNVPAELAYVQSAKETNYGHFTGIVPANYHNWAGIKTKDGGSDTDPNAHQQFHNDTLGVLAHIQHLAKYGGQSVPANGDLLIDPRSQWVTQGSTPNIEDLGGKYAPSLTYGYDLVELVNNLYEFSLHNVPSVPSVPMEKNNMRILVAAGHEGIQNITADMIGQKSANTLRGSTGALGIEAEYNGPWADSLCALLRNVGVDAVRLGATYSNEYEQDADLLIFGHCDGVDTPNHTQWCMASCVYSGNPTSQAIQTAENLVKVWYDIYPSSSGIVTNGPVTNDMQQYYGGWYRTENTPAVLIEHGILGSGNQRRYDFPNPQDAAQIDFEVISKVLGLEMPEQDVPNAQTFDETGKTSAGGFYQFWRKYNGLRIFGFPITEELDENGLRVQYYERARFEWHPGIDPDNYDVLLGLIGAELLQANARIIELMQELDALKAQANN